MGLKARDDMLQLLKAKDDDVCLSTPLCKSKRGGLKDTHPDEILAPVLKMKLEISSSYMSWDLAPKEKGNAEWLFFMLAFLKLFQLGLTTANRQCSSVLQAVVDVAASIKPGSSNGGYIKKCFTALWHDEEGTRPGCSELNITI
ncbi:3-ketoacyl-CoA thiolase 2, peroxisomal [Tanacetum coccineum]